MGYKRDAAGHIIPSDQSVTSTPFQHIARIITEFGLANVESVFPLHELTR